LKKRKKGEIRIIVIATIGTNPGVYPSFVRADMEFVHWPTPNAEDPIID
jgi:hypothetical protein